MIRVETITGKKGNFGSIAAIYDVFTAKELRVSQSRLYQVRVTKDKPYKNKVCTISNEVVHRKKGNRKQKKAS